MTGDRAWRSGVRALRYAAWPRSVLYGRLSRRLSRPGRPCHLVTSGRVALMLVAKSVAARTDRRVALVPDYICNVVPAAVERAGFTAESYPTDSANEPDSLYLEARLGRGDAGVLVTASVFGSSAWLDRLASAGVRQLIRQTGTHVIVDACQDLSLIDHLPDGYGDHLSAVVSFNNKSIPGLMGGGAATGLPLAIGPEPALTAAQRSFFRRQTLARLRAGLAGRDNAGGGEDAGTFEYSYCRTFPYDFDSAGISKLQLVAALAGLDRLPAFTAAKEALFAACGDAVVMPRFRTAAYVVATDPSVMPERRRKRPYADSHDPASSLRPDQVVLHNKGFLDD